MDNPIILSYLSILSKIPYLLILSVLSSLYKDGFGVKLYDLKDGQRKSLKAVVARFKRLDWGPWIRWRVFIIPLS